MMTVNDARSLLPEVGDVRMERPTIDETTPSRGSIQYTTPQRCVVVYVNRAHLRYTVEFENGFRESYKVPKLKTREQGGIL
jgi:hypothetical protein